MKTPEQILVRLALRTDFAKTESWIYEAMKEYAKQWVDRTINEACDDDRDINFLTRELHEQIDAQ